MHRTAIAWFRRDLRLADNPALAYAVEHAKAVVPAYVYGDRSADGTPTAKFAPGAASRAWLERSLSALDDSLAERGSGLSRLTGPAARALPALAALHSATLITCSRDWSPEGMAEESALRAALTGSGIELFLGDGQLLVEPDRVRTAGGTPYSVFTPFSRAWAAAWRPTAPLPAPARIPRAASSRDGGTAGPVADPAAAATAGSLPGNLEAWWTPGELGAHLRLEAFSAACVRDYDRDRDTPGLSGTSGLSAHLAFGEVSPRQVVSAVLANSPEDVAWPFIRQLAWREFSYQVLHAHPATQSEPLKPQYAAFPWRDDARGTQAWLDGRTGFPLVDAGMRQLAETGWMHNRVRLVAASFLVKDLLVPWQTGEAAFRDRLIDYDPAANAFNWQWVAGSGADAAPYFRIFNPATQAKRFDPLGGYVRRWVPEYDTPQYPARIVDHAEARTRALAALASIGSSGATWE